MLCPSRHVAISSTVCNQPVPLALQQDLELWSSCISGAWLEKSFLEDFRKLGLIRV
ncbi:hypothetical protein OMCYN_01103 [cyanobiont of Ornithocercus magnificus]|nr:hypothetical protein OMCYN_01103 [cyanobiont of Ornithocercus magnificus]